MSTTEMSRQDYINLIFRILGGSTEPFERPLPDPWNTAVNHAFEADGDPYAWKELCLRSLNGQAESIIEEVFVLLNPEDDKPGDARQGEVTKRYPPSLSFDDLLRLPPKEWLAKGLFGPCDFAIIFGRENRGKTFITCDLIMSLISGQPFAGLFEVTRPCRIYYCTDEGRGGIPARFAAAARRHGLQTIRPEQLRVNFTVPQLFDQKAETNWQNFIQGVIDELGSNVPDVLILDTLFNATVGARENVSDDAGIAIAAAKLIRDTLGCTVILIHHSDKGDNWPRGTSAWMGSMDVIIHVDTGKVSCFKAKDAPKFADLGFELTPEGDSVAIAWTGPARKDSDKNAESIIDQNVPDGTNHNQMLKICAGFGVGRPTAESAMDNLVKTHKWTIKPGTNRAKLYHRVRFKGLQTQMGV
jgi:hypothetical protein